jgi:hypothetical protein
MVTWGKPRMGICVRIHLYVYRRFLIKFVRHLAEGGGEDAFHVVTVCNMRSGKGNPGIRVFSQTYQTLGCHFGLEITDLHQVAEMNATAVTREGMKNFEDRKFKLSTMKENGELEFIRPPHVLFEKGDIMDLQHLNGMDVVTPLILLILMLPKRLLQRH